MPGEKQKILEISCYGLYNSVGWTWAYQSLTILGDTAKLWEREIYSGSNEWMLNKYQPDLDISNVNELDVRVWQDTNIYLGTYVDIHANRIKLDCEYYSKTPPETATVKITVANSQTGDLVKGAYVALMSGARIVASGYTDDGNVVFNNIEEGSYTVKVLAGGYYDFEQSIDVEPPSVWYTIKIVPIPVTPVPTWVYWAVGGVAALGAVTVIPSLIRRKGEEEKIVVVR
jgi:hypothetical protein